jgi:Ca2+-binding RTX toxin-like protein
MTTHFLEGIGLQFDANSSTDIIVSTAPAVFTGIVADNVTSFTYSVIESSGNGFDLVELDASILQGAVNSLTFGGAETLGFEPAIYTGEIIWDGNVTQVLDIETEDGVYLFRLGGAALPTIETVQEAQAFEASITSFGPIPASSPLAAGNNIDWSSLPDHTDATDNPIEGTIFDDVLAGTSGNDWITTGSNQSTDVVIGSAGFDIIDFSGYETGTGDFYNLQYDGLSAGITLTTDFETGVATVDKGVNGVDNLIDAHVVMNWNFGDGLYFNGSDHDDVFNINNGPENTWTGLLGGDGADTYNVSGGDIVRIAFVHGANNGADVNLATGVVADDGHGNVEQINVLNADVRIEIEGTRFDDNIVGSDRDERFILREGDDTLDAGGGDDVLRYNRSGVGAVDVNLAAGTVTGHWDGVAFTHTVSNVEQIWGSRSGTDQLIGDNTGNLFFTYSGDDTLMGGGGDDTLSAGQDDDVIDGGSGTDTAIISASIDDAIVYRTGNGVYVSSSFDGMDLLVNVETIQFWDGTVTVSDLAVQSNSASSGDDTIIGNAAGNILDGNTGDDILFGLRGDDSLSGGDGDDSLRGHSGDDTLLGGEGNDTIWGDAGDDYINPGENNLGYDLILPGTGNDTVDLSEIELGYVEINHRELDAGIIATIDGVANSGSVDKGVNGTTTLLDVVNPMNFWGLELEGTEYDDTFNIAMDTTKYQWTAIDAAGGDNTINIISGSSEGTLRLNYVQSLGSIDANLQTGIIQNGLGGTDTVTGTGPVIELRGSNNTDNIIGSDGDDRFILQLGSDTLDGGNGYDVLRYDRFGVEDLVVDFENGVATGTWFDNLFEHTFSNIEEVRGSTSADELTGDATNNALVGEEGDDTLMGQAGDDTLDGGTGEDLMIGGQGSDVFYVDNILDRVGESRSWTGTDTVISSVDFRTENRHIENVELTGDAVIGAGNGLQNVITGNDADNILDGGKNNDTLQGGEGDDIYLLRAPGDTIVELADEGIDVARSYGSFALMANVEKLFMQTVYSKDGTPVNFNGIGNALDNTIVGTPFDNTIVGREGSDTLKGQAGDDTFVFDRGIGAHNVDRIIDFEVISGDNDTLKIKGALLGGAVSTGVLAASELAAGTVAGDADDRFVFDQAGGNLWFDADGTGAVEQVLIATFDQNALVEADDILIF